MDPARWLTVTSGPVPAVADGRSCRTRAAFFQEVARVLDLPSYFGRNWDALTDSLRDTGPVGLVVTHAEDLLAAEPAGQLAALLRVMSRAAADGHTLTLHTTAGREDALRRRVEAALP